MPSYKHDPPSRSASQESVPGPRELLPTTDRLDAPSASQVISPPSSPAGRSLLDVPLHWSANRPVVEGTKSLVAPEAQHSRPGAGGIHEAVAHGLSGSAEALPYRDRIQKAFGHHDISNIRAYIDSAASESAELMDAVAFASGRHVGFASPPDLRTAAHEAAHVVQQRAGLRLPRGMGAIRDVHEQHADAVANLVVQGQSAANLLDRYGGPTLGLSTAQAPAERGLMDAGSVLQHKPMALSSPATSPMRDRPFDTPPSEALQPEATPGLPTAPVAAAGFEFASIPLHPPTDGSSTPNVVQFTKKSQGKSKRRLNRARKARGIEPALRAVSKALPLRAMPPINPQGSSTASKAPPEIRKSPKAIRKAQKSHVPRTRYMPGTHGYKKSEQSRLSRLNGIKVSGDTHESEHVIGFEPLNQTSGLRRGTAGRARTLENTAPAYQEVKDMHRRHIGTGTHSEADQSGMNSKQYRDAQRTLLEARDVSSAVQLNQLGYAHLLDENQNHPFQNLSNTTHGRASNDSYATMVENMSSVMYAQGTNNVKVDVDERSRAEMYLARLAAQTGRFPTVDEENAVRKRFGLELYEVPKQTMPTATVNTQRKEEMEVEA